MTGGREGAGAGATGGWWPLLPVARGVPRLAPAGTATRGDPRSPARPLLLAPARSSTDR